MSEPSTPSKKAVIAVLASFGRDAQTLATIVERAGADAQICEHAQQICTYFTEETAAILITEECLAEAENTLQRCLRDQPAWSDVPVIILSGGRGRSGTQARWQFFRQFGNVTVLDRPLSGDALVVALEAARRARAWQYVVRDQMRKLEEHNLDLERKVQQRTQALREESEERKRIESALNEARRLEAVGRLAGGIAHDFNNLLQVITGACNLLPHVRQDAARTESLITAIKRATERGGKLTRQMLAFGRRQVLSTDALDIAQHLMEMKELLQQSLREKITLELRLQGDLWQVHADVTQLEVALLNLTINAKDVLQDGGTVTVTARNVSLPSFLIPESTELTGDFVWLAVSDTGPGMPSQVAAQAFEPFFTTKSLGEGSGLGLSQVYGFAKQSGGTAWIRSGSDGTTVSLLLPRGIPQHKQQRDEQVFTPGRIDQLQGVRVLCVEDDAAVGDLAVSLLEALGCQAHWVRNADEALHAEPSSYDLVFSDVQMPGSMDGIGLAKEIHKRHPQLPILLASGYVLSPDRLRQLQVRMLEKPYTADALREALLASLPAGRQQIGSA